MSTQYELNQNRLIKAEREIMLLQNELEHTKERLQIMNDYCLALLEGKNIQEAVIERRVKNAA